MTATTCCVRFLVTLPLLLVSLVLHELAHGWVAWKLGDPTAKRARPPDAQPAQAPRPVGHGHAGRDVPRFGRELLLRLGQAGAGRPAALQGRAARHDAGRRGRAGDELRRWPPVAAGLVWRTYTWSLFAAQALVLALRAQRDPRDPQPAARSRLSTARGARRPPAARALPALGRRSTATATTSSSSCSCVMLGFPQVFDATIGAVLD